MSDNNDALVKAIRDANLNDLLPKLLKAAAAILRRRRWAGGSDYQPSAVEARELVNETIKRIFEGKQKPAFDGDLRKAFLIAMDSVTSSAAKKLRKMTLTNDLDGHEPHDETASNDGDEVVLDAVRTLVSSTGDSELEEYLLGVEYYGPKRDDIAKGLNWKPDKVSVVSKKLKRLIDRSRIPIPSLRGRS